MKVRRTLIKAPLTRIKSGEASCFEVTDSSVLHLSAIPFLKGNLSRDPNPQAARLSKQFINQNRGILGNFGITVEQTYDGNSVGLVLKTSSRIGAIPLLSPSTGKPDYGLIIKPRFDWSGIGPLLGEMGWRVIPVPLRLPLLPRSDRKIPPWVLSTIILFRIKNLLERLERRFEFTETNLTAPRGTVNWARYAVEKIPIVDFLSVPCRYPDLRDDRELKSAIHFTLKKQLSSLESQRIAGIAVLQLIAICQSLIERVQGVPPKQASPLAVNAWIRGPFRTEVFRDGLQAIEWTIEDRGLAGLSDLEGLPWVMSMEEFFEAWLETVVEKLARRIGGIIRIGRKRETIAPITWDPPYLGSQKYLLPDLVLEREDEVIIFDAKYKDHWEELKQEKWSNIEEEIRKRHRVDLFQILAYSTLFTTKRIICCLVYPCRKQTWDSLKSRGRLYHYASIYAGNRKVNLVLIAIPMEAALQEVVESFVAAIKRNSADV